MATSARGAGARFVARAAGAWPHGRVSRRNATAHGAHTRAVSTVQSGPSTTQTVTSCVAKRAPSMTRASRSSFGARVPSPSTECLAPCPVDTPVPSAVAAGSGGTRPRRMQSAQSDHPQLAHISDPCATAHRAEQTGARQTMHREAAPRQDPHSEHCARCVLGASNARLVESPLGARDMCTVEMCTTDDVVHAHVQARTPVPLQPC